MLFLFFFPCVLILFGLLPFILLFLAQLLGQNAKIREAIKGLERTNVYEVRARVRHRHRRVAADGGDGDDIDGQ